MNLKELQKVVAASSLKVYKGLTITDGMFYHNGFWYLKGNNGFAQLKVKWDIGPGTFLIPLPVFKKAKKIELEAGIVKIDGMKHPSTDYQEARNYPFTKEFKPLFKVELFIPNLLTDTICGKNELRPAEMGIYYDGPNACFVAANNYILKIWDTEKEKHDCSILFPSTIKMFAGQTVQVTVGDDCTSVTNGDVEFTFEELKEEDRNWKRFPDYKIVFPDPEQTQVVVSIHKKNLLDGIKPFKSYNGRTILHISKEGELFFSPYDEDLRDQKVKSFGSAVMNEPEDFAIAFDVNYMEALVKTISSAFVSLAMQAPYMPIVVDKKAIIMPVQL